MRLRLAKVSRGDEQRCRLICFVLPSRIAVYALITFLRCHLNRLRKWHYKFRTAPLHVEAYWWGKGQERQCVACD